MNIHKTMTLKHRKYLGYEGYLERSLCNKRIFAPYCGSAPFLSYRWHKVTCKKCIKLKEK